MSTTTFTVPSPERVERAISVMQGEGVVSAHHVIDPAVPPNLLQTAYEQFNNEVLAQARRSGWRGTTGAFLSKSFRLKFNRVLVRGTAIVNFSSQARRAWNALEFGSGSMLNNMHLGWRRAGTVKHPHEVDDQLPYLCHTLIIRSPEVNRLRYLGNLPGWLVGVVDGAYREFNPNNLGNSSWGECPACRTVTHLASHRCAQAGRRIGPTLAKFETSVLVGCGVTGSWMLPVLSRTSRLVMVYDRDTVSRLNPNGRWSGPQLARTRKIVSAIEPRYLETTIPVYHVFGRNTRVPHVDLLVLAPDRALARRQAVQNQWVSEQAWIVDMRVAGDQLVIWTFQKESAMYVTWRDDIDSYIVREAEPQPCGRFHDNIPLVAGTVAASFLSWWTTREPEEGIWSPQLSQPWENMARPGELVDSEAVTAPVEEIEATDDDLEAQRAWDEAHAEHVEEERDAHR